MLIWTYDGDGRINHTWHENEADALQSLLNTLPTWWIIIGVGEDGTQREPNYHPKIVRTSGETTNVE